MKKKIVIIDYGIGNVTSVFNAISWLGYHVKVSRDEHLLREADFLILPGVGAFHEGMNNLRNLNLIDLLNDVVLECKKPIMGICLGMQLMANSSEENGLHEGFGWINGDVKLLNLPNDFRVPHVGWNNVKFLRNSNISSRLSNNIDFYFDHSFHYICSDPKNVLASTNYNIEIAAAINNEHIWGVQFHPEKSQNNGLRLFKGIIDSI